MKPSFLKGLAAVVFVFLSIPIQSQDLLTKARQDMVEQQIKARGVADAAVLNAMGKVPRHIFVPSSYRNHAYEDRPLPIGYGQTISQPYMVGFMTEVIQPQPGFKVLEIGTGSGYQAAVLGEIVGQVYTIEIVSQLGNAAASRLSQLGYRNIQVKVADGYNGWPEKGPFDAIIVSAAAEFIPPPLIEQLKEGGRMVIPVGLPNQAQTLMLVEKGPGGRTSTKRLVTASFVPFIRG